MTEEIYTLFKGTGAKMIGHWPTDGYQHEDSKVCSHAQTCAAQQYSMPQHFFHRQWQLAILLTQTGAIVMIA